MRSYPGFCRRKQLEYNPGLTHRRRAGHPRANRRTSDRPSFCGVRLDPAQNAARGSDFNPRTPCGVRQFPGLVKDDLRRFQSTHPLRGATHKKTVKDGIIYFNPRTPCRVRRHKIDLIRPVFVFQSTHPLRGATMPSHLIEDFVVISIHAPLAGCDLLPGSGSGSIPDFNPRTPCGVRPAISSSSLQSISHFNPRTPCGVRLAMKNIDPFTIKISIHAPLAGCDRLYGLSKICEGNFNPRTPCGVRPRQGRAYQDHGYFNPRTPCGVRPSSMHSACAVLHFNPRTPCGVRLVGQKSESLYIDDFNPRTPCGVRQAMRGVMRFADAISIHAPLAGCDFLRRLSANGSVGFQSTHPLRGATVRRKGSTSSSF